MCLWYERMVSWMWMCLQANGWVSDQWMEWMLSFMQHRLKTEQYSTIPECSGMIACACGMSEWLVECECVCRRMDEWVISGWNECWASCNTGWKLNCSQLLWSIYIHIQWQECMTENQRERDKRETDRQTRERETERERQKRETRERDEREKTGIRSVRLEDCFSTWTGVNGSKGHKQQTSQQHYFKKKKKKSCGLYSVIPDEKTHLILSCVCSTWQRKFFKWQHFTWHQPCNNQRVLPVHHFCGHW